MKTHHTEPHLRKGIRLYLASRGKRKFSAIWGMPIKMKQLAWEQDCIGWRHFTEGKISKGSRARQEMHLRRRRTNLTADSWTEGFVERLLAMNHKQWIFQCITKPKNWKEIAQLDFCPDNSHSRNVQTLSANSHIQDLDR